MANGTSGLFIVLWGNDGADGSILILRYAIEHGIKLL